MEIFFNNNDEVEFLNSFLSKNKAVLEWGSGGSSLFIAERVLHLDSIEHDIEWFNKVNFLRPSNMNLHYVPKNSEELPGHDGTYENYKDYVNFPLTLNRKYYLIFIDGRARVDCAKIASLLLEEDGIILIHDYRNPNPIYRRWEYEEVEEFLTIKNGVYALWSFTIKR